MHLAVVANLMLNGWITHIHHLGRKPVCPVCREHLEEARDSHEDLNAQNHGLSSEFIGRPCPSEEHNDVTDGVSGCMISSHTVMKL